MSDTVIRVENLSKKYIISHQQEVSNRHKTLRDAIVDGVKSIGSGIFSTNKNIPNSQREEFWALKDVSFEIKQGDRVGIIGRNGAGKSTLLKILSRITEPSEGQIKIKGRVASLLEVGTGFHPELTGRENIYLNGAILGMSKVEIRKKFDEIVEFAEVEKFLDTPVKRYSSGMYVRLAFAVAAHLEPEIMIVDEVLAVGDATFQKKCLGKIQDVSDSEGRTVLFVSHNIDAIQRLCSQCVMLERGQLVLYDDTTRAVQKYISTNFYQASPNEWIDISNAMRMGTGEAHFTAIQYSSMNEAVSFQPYPTGLLEFSMTIDSEYSMSVGSLAVTIYNQSGTQLVNADTLSIGQVIDLKKGSNLVKLTIESLYLNPGIYLIGLWLDKKGISSKREALDCLESAFEIEVVNPGVREFGLEAFGAVVCQFNYAKIN